MQWCILLPKAWLTRTSQRRGGGGGRRRGGGRGERSQTQGKARVMYNVVMLPKLRDAKLALKMSSTKYGTTNIVLDKVRYSCVFIRLWDFDWHVYLLSFHAVTESLQCKTFNCCNGQSDCGCGNDSNVQYQRQSTKRIPAIKSARPRHRRVLSWLRKRVKWCIDTDQSEIYVVR